MKLAPYARCAPCILFCAFLLVPAFAQGPAGKHPGQQRAVEVPFFALVEAIEFQDVSPEKQKLVLDRIGVRVGDMLTVEVRHRIGRELSKVEKGMTFTYKAGSKRGTAKLIIQADC